MRCTFSVGVLLCVSLLLLVAVEARTSVRADEEITQEDLIMQLNKINKKLEAQGYGDKQAQSTPINGRTEERKTSPPTPASEIPHVSAAPLPIVECPPLKCPACPKQRNEPSITELTMNFTLNKIGALLKTLYIDSGMISAVNKIENSNSVLVRLHAAINLPSENATNILHDLTAQSDNTSPLPVHLLLELIDVSSQLFKHATLEFGCLDAPSSEHRADLSTFTSWYDAIQRTDPRILTLYGLLLASSIVINCMLLGKSTEVDKSTARVKQGSREKTRLNPSPAAAIHSSRASCCVDFWKLLRGMLILFVVIYVLSICYQINQQHARHRAKREASKNLPPPAGCDRLGFVDVWIEGNVVNKQCVEWITLQTDLPWYGNPMDAFGQVNHELASGLSGAAGIIVAAFVNSAVGGLNWEAMVKMIPLSLPVLLIAVLLVFGFMFRNASYHGPLGTISMSHPPNPNSSPMLNIVSLAAQVAAVQPQLQSASAQVAPMLPANTNAAAAPIEQKQHVGEQRIVTVVTPLPAAAVALVARSDNPDSTLSIADSCTDKISSAAEPVQNGAATREALAEEAKADN